MPERKGAERSDEHLEAETREVVRALDAVLVAYGLEGRAPKLAYGGATLMLEQPPS